jgi:hypothetical protein
MVAVVGELLLEGADPAAHPVLEDGNRPQRRLASPPSASLHML